MILLIIINIYTIHYNQPSYGQELEMRIDTQKQTLTARDESIKKLLEMLQNKGEGEMRMIVFRKGKE